MVKKVLFGVGGAAAVTVAVFAALVGVCGAVGLVQTDDRAGFVLACVGVLFLAREVFQLCDGRMEAVVDAEIAADAERFEAEMAAKRAEADACAKAERAARFEAEMAADRAKFEADMAELFGGLETVGSGEVSEGDLFAFDDLPAEVQASIEAKRADVDALRKQYERGIISAAEYDRQVFGLAGKDVTDADPEEGLTGTEFQPKYPLIEFAFGTAGDRNGRDKVVGTGRFEVRRLVCDGLPPFVGVEMNPTRMPAYRMANVRAKYTRRQQKGGTLN